MKATHPLRTSPFRDQALVAASVVVAFSLAACSGGNSGGRDRYEAHIRWTSHGIPHIEAADLPSLGFGEGYAQARDHLCSVADQVIRARGERAKYFGAGERDRHLNSDLAMKALRLQERAAAVLASRPELAEWHQGYVDGYNLYLEETGKDQLTGWCRGADWVFPITTTDLGAYHQIISLITSNFADMIATAQPPGDGAIISASLPFPEPDRASNGWGLGRDRSQAGRGMLIANPHYPWVGSNRFWEKHLTIPGDMDVYGVGLLGIPGVAIGFNKAVGWTHTVSAGQRFTLYSLDLVLGNPTRYRYDHEEREITARAVSAEVKQDDGSLETVERTLYFSHYGPILNFPGVGWGEQRAISIRDANEHNDEMQVQWLEMNRASSMDEFQATHDQLAGMPWVNTISSSAEGRAWYADYSATPNLSQPALEAWQLALETDALAGGLWKNRRLVLLDGSDSTFEWSDDPEARDPGVLPASSMPQLERTDYVFNANDSYWLANSSALVTGYSPLQGSEETSRSLRTRMNDTTLANTSPSGPAGSDGKFDLDELSAAIFSNRSFTAKVVLSDLVKRCQAQPRVALDDQTVDLVTACSVLSEWDGRYELESRGAVLFREFIAQYTPTDTRTAGRLFAVPFDPSDPVGTPRELAKGPLALENLGRAVLLLQRNDVALDVPLGEMQFAERGGRRIPIHGGDGTMEGIENFVRNNRNGSTLEPMDYWPPVKGSRFLTAEGYPVNSGSSFVMALEYTDDGPRARALLTYSQSGDPTSEHYWDQTELFSKKQWRPILFDERDIAGDVKEEMTVRGARTKAAPPAPRER